MKVALLAPLEHPISEPYAGGLEKHTAELAAGLAAAGVVVTLFARPGSTPIAGVRHVPTDSYLSVIRKVRATDHELLHNNSIHFLPVLVAAVLPIPVVTTLHVPPYRRLLLGPLINRLTDKVAFVAVSKDLANHWRPHVPRSTVIHNGIAVNDWQYAPAGRADTALWAGRFVPEKAPHLAIEASIMAGYRLSLAGPVENTSYFSARIKPHLDGKRISYLGHLSQPELNVHIGRASVGLYTSVWREPFGYTLLEMMACGTPVAGFATGAAPEIVGPETGALVKAGNVSHLAGSMRAAAGLSRAGCRRYVDERFSLRAMITNYLAIYRSRLATG